MAQTDNIEDKAVHKPQEGATLPSAPAPVPPSAAGMENIEDTAAMKAAEDNPTISISRSAIKELLAQEQEQLAKGAPFDVGVKEVKPPPVEKKTLKISCFTCGQKLDVTELPSFSKFACPECKASIIVPKWFDNYLLEEPGGVGGMATVYRALDLALDREVAIKILNPEVASQGERSKLFLHEGRTAATVNNPHVIPIYTCGEFENQPYLVMQFMGGGSLDKILDNKLPLPIDKAVAWLRNVADGLDCARRHGIIHHDVKPANILLDNDGNAKIGDFGISQAIYDTRSKEIDDLTKAWLSPLYVSPEKVINGKEDYMGDIYSLGATFYHMLTRLPPFDSTDINTLIKDRLLKDPVDPRKIDPEVPAAISSLIMRMLSRDPDERPRYNEIRQVADEFLKSEKAAAVKKRKSSTPPAGRQAAPVDSLEESPEQHAVSGPSFRAGLVSILTHLVVWIVLVAVFVFVLKDHLVKNSGKDPSTDLIPYATSAFREGNPIDGVDVAKQALESAEVVSVEVKKQAGVQLGFGYYLVDDESAKQRCEVLAKQLEAVGVSRSDPAVEVLRFLSNDDYSADYLQKRMTEEKPGHQAMARLAICLRALYNQRPSAEWTVDWNEYVNARIPEEHWTGAWRKRANERWYRWLMMGQGNPAELEPLVGKSKVKASPPQSFSAAPAAAKEPRPSGDAGKAVPAVGGTTVAVLQGRRTFAAGRPKPDTLSFSQDDFMKYLSGIPDAVKESEKARFECVSQTKQYIVKLFKLNPQYQFDGGNVALKSGETLRVSSIMLSQDTLTLILQDGGKKKIQWAELALPQVLKFIEAFAEKKLQVSDPNKKKSFAADAANDFLVAAVLSDWYGKYDESVKYAKKAIAVDPEVASKVEQLLQ